jgi:hypothetical protein
VLNGWYALQARGVPTTADKDRLTTLGLKRGDRVYVEEGDGQRLIRLLESVLFGARIRVSRFEGEEDLDLQVLPGMPLS